VLFSRSLNLFLFGPGIYFEEVSHDFRDPKILLKDIQKFLVVELLGPILFFKLLEVRKFVLLSALVISLKVVDQISLQCRESTRREGLKTEVRNHARAVAILHDCVHLQIGKLLLLYIFIRKIIGVDSYSGRIV